MPRLVPVFVTCVAVTGLQDLGQRDPRAGSAPPPWSQHAPQIRRPTRTFRPTKPCSKSRRSKGGTRYGLGGWQSLCWFLLQGWIGDACVGMHSVPQDAGI